MESLPVSGKISAADLIKEHTTLDDWIAAETKRFGEHLAPTKKRCDEIKGILLGMMHEQKQNSMSTDNGTAYISTITTPKVIDRDKYLDFVWKCWDNGGNEMLQLGAPQKDSLKEYLEANQNQPPPGVEVNYFNRVNIRRS
jgi:hypothetical protein